MTASNGHRRTLQLTGRDGDALRWTGEMFAARVDTLAVLLGRLSPVPVRSGYVTDRVVRRVVGRWERAGLARVQSMLGRVWAVPTARGLAYAGLTNGEHPWTEWHPAKPRLAHVHACGLVRLAVESDLGPGGRWESERWLRRLADADRYHLPDGLVVTPAGERWAVEVELTMKSDANLSPVLANLRPGLHAVVYFTPAELLERIGQQLQRVTNEVAAQPGVVSAPVVVSPIHVRPLPPVAGASYEGRW